MRILILGGTRFIGPHVVRHAKEGGHELTLFNRGKTDPEAFPDCEQLRGDRESGDVDALTTGEWDAVIDTCAFYPRVVDEALTALQGRARHYLIVSTISVYDPFDPEGFDEDARLAVTDRPEAEEVTPENYGALKVLCERAAKRFEGGVTIVRPGLVAGPGDTTDRFTYWPVKFDAQEEVLVPGTPDDPIQYIDVRDLAEFMVGLVASSTEGVFNAVTPRGAHSMGELVERCLDASSTGAEPVWVSADFLHAREVKAWRDLPAWVPPGSPLAGVPHAISTRAVDAGLTFRTLGQTVSDTLHWFERERGDDLGAGLSQARERELLAEWGAGE